MYADHLNKIIRLCFLNLSFQLKVVAKEQPFESANVIVKQVTDTRLLADQPEGARTSHDALLKLCNRTPKEWRPKDPAQLDLQVRK